jgi:hypothetical protein
MPRQKQKRPRQRPNTESFWALLQDVWAETEEAYCDDECTATSVQLQEGHTRDANFSSNVVRVSAALTTLGMQCFQDGNELRMSWARDSPSSKVRNRTAGLLEDLLNARGANLRQFVPEVTCPTCNTCQQASRMLRAFAGVVGWTVVGSNTCAKYVFSSLGARTKSVLPPTRSTTGPTQWSSEPEKSMGDSFWKFFMGVWQDLVPAYASESDHASIPLLQQHKDDPDFLLNFAHVCGALTSLDIQCRRTPPTEKCRDDTLTLSWNAGDELDVKVRQSVTHTLSLLLGSRHEGTCTLESGCPDCPACQRAAQTLKKFSTVVGWHVASANGEGVTKITF